MSQEPDLSKFKYCVLRSDSTLKEIVKKRIVKQQTSLKQVCEKNGLDYNRLHTYMNKPYFDSHGLAYPSQKEVMLLCAAVGLEVGLNIVAKKKSPN